MRKLDLVDLKSGFTAAGNRGYFLKNYAVDLNIALIKFGVVFLDKFCYKKFWAPLFLKQEIMKKCAQLEDYEDQLYKLVRSNKEYFLIATAEQAICAKLLKNSFYIPNLPEKYSCFSTCFRKEAGSHGKDTNGIFRVHQFEKVEQFIISYTRFIGKNRCFLKLIECSQLFYKILKIPYQLVLLDSKDLNYSSYCKFDIEAWFPGSQTYREVVSCTNCLDYQVNNLQIKIKNNYKAHCSLCTFNSTLVATQRMLCALLENHQNARGINIPIHLAQIISKSFLSFKIFF
mmetsp:Transcript_20974/g.29329  ORF Transcript_20974/g.29329 Transcript_20974/m.29329 type:complete len:287 (-) Transcript_20974:3209-4069(-)